MNKPASDSFNAKYKIIAKIGEGSYSEVLKCKNRATGDNYACKRLKHNYKNWHQVNEISEIVALRKLQRHPNILQMIEIHYDPGLSSVSLVFEIMDMNLYELIKERKRRLIGEGRVRLFVFQLTRAIRHLHKNGIYHRDVKPENILLKNDLLKLGDLGSVRGIYSKSPYTEYISTRWYRSPECLLTSGHYNYKMDVWSIGCVFYEILTLRPLFPGQSEIDQISRIHNIIGPPPKPVLEKFRKYMEDDRRYAKGSSRFKRHEELKKILSELNTTEKDGKEEKKERYDWYFQATKETTTSIFERLLPQQITKEAKHLLKVLLNYDPDGRPSAHKALHHPYFKDLREQAHITTRLRTSNTDGPPIPSVTIAGDDKLSELAAKEMDSIDITTLGNPKGLHPGPLKTTHSRKELMEESKSKRRIPSITPKTSISKLSKAIKEELKASREESAAKKAHESESIIKKLRESDPLKEIKSRLPSRIPTMVKEEKEASKGVGDNPSVNVLKTTKNTTKFNEERILQAARLLSLKHQELRNNHEFSTPSISSSLDDTQDSLIGSKKASRRPSAQIINPSMSLVKHQTSSIGLGKKKGHLTLENKPSMTYLQSAEIFPRKVIKNKDLTESGMIRINKTRILVNLEPIDVKAAELILKKSSSSLRKNQNNNPIGANDEVVERQDCFQYVANIFPSPKRTNDSLPLIEKEIDSKSVTPLLTPIGSPKKKHRDKDLNSNMKKSRNELQQHTEKLRLNTLYKSESLNSDLIKNNVLFKKEVLKREGEDILEDRKKGTNRHDTKKYPNFVNTSKGVKTKKSGYIGRRKTPTPKSSPFASPRKFLNLKRSPGGILKKRKEELDISIIHRFRYKENRLPIPNLKLSPVKLLQDLKQKRGIAEQTGTKNYNKLEEKVTGRTLLKNSSPRREYPTKTHLSYAAKSPYNMPASTVSKLKSTREKGSHGSSKPSRIPVKKDEKPAANLAFPRNRFRDEPKVEKDFTFIKKT